MKNEEIALLAIKHRAIYDLKLNSYVWVNKLIYWEDELMISSYAVHYRVSDYEKTWKLSVDEEYEQRQALNKDFEEWLNSTKLHKNTKTKKIRRENETITPVRH